MDKKRFRLDELEPIMDSLFLIIRLRHNYILGFYKKSSRFGNRLDVEFYEGDSQEAVLSAIYKEN